jgi:hypothetical protein
VVAPVRIWVDGRLTVHERVEEGERAVEPEAFRANLQDQEGRVARGLDVQGDELSRIQPRLGPELGCVNRDRFPRHSFHCSARLEEERLHPREI